MATGAAALPVVPRFAEDGGLPMTMALSELVKFVADDRAKWHRIAELAGTTPE